MQLQDNKDNKNDLRGHRLTLTCLCIDSNDLHVFSGSKDGSIIKWSIKDNKLLAKVKSIPKKDYDDLDETNQKKHHTKHINCLAISSDNKYLASGGYDKHIRIWNPQNLQWIHTFSMHKQEINCLTFRLGNLTLYSGSTDRSVMLWSMEDEDNFCFVESLYGHESPVTSIDCLRRERVLTSGGRDQSIRIWKIVDQAQTVFETKHESADIAKFIDDQMFVSGGEDGTICVWTTMKRTPVVSVKNAHKPEIKIQEGLSYWISALSTYSLKKSDQATLKKRKIDDDDNDVLIAKYGDDDDDDNDDNEDQDQENEQNNEQKSALTTPEKDKHREEGDAQQADKKAVALIASGSCDSLIKVWHLIKDGSKFSLELIQTFECPGFVNDLKFSSDGNQLYAACGQEHKSGRWWKLKSVKNSFKKFRIDK